MIGVLEVKTLLDELGVSESTPALKLLEIFREEQQSIALVVDEYSRGPGDDGPELEPRGPGRARPGPVF